MKLSKVEHPTSFKRKENTSVYTSHIYQKKKNMSNNWKQGKKHLVKNHTAAQRICINIKKLPSQNIFAEKKEAKKVEPLLR